MRVFREKHEVAAFAAHEGSVASIDAVQRGSLCVAVTSGSDGCVRRWAGEQLSSAGRCRLLKNGTVVKCCLIDDSEDDYALCATEAGTVLTCVPGADDKRVSADHRRRLWIRPKVAAVVVSGHFAPITCLAAHPSQSAFCDLRFRQQNHHLGRGRGLKTASYFPGKLWFCYKIRREGAVLVRWE